MAAFDPHEYIFQCRAEERSRFEKLPKEEQERILKERETKRIRDGWAAMRSSNWRWRGR